MGLSKQSIAKLWKNFNDIAVGYGITKDELYEIFIDLKYEFNTTNMIAIKEMVYGLFKLFDTDLNDLADALEINTCITSLSGMRFHEIISHILHIYDFDGKELLSVDEVMLSLKSLCLGLCKVSIDEKYPIDDDIEQLVITTFFEEIKKDINDRSKLKISTIVERLCGNPDIISWHSYYIPVENIYNLNHDEVALTQRDITIEAFNQTKWNLGLPYMKKGHFCSNEPWLSTAAILVPLKHSSLPPITTNPSTSLELDYIYGYEGEKCRNNVYYAADGAILYTISRYVIVYYTDSYCQNVFTLHENSVSSLSVNPKRDIAATAEFGSHSTIIVWDIKSFEVYFKDNISCLNGVVNISFSDDGENICTLTSDYYNIVNIYNWKKNELVFSTQVSKLNCYCANILKDGTIVVGGDRSLWFWQRNSEGYFKRQGIFSKSIPSQSITAIVSISSLLDTIVTGTTSGLLLFWVERSCTKHVRGHYGDIFSLYSSLHCILSGGKDCRIRTWSHNLEPGAIFDITGFGSSPIINALCLSSDGKSIVVGTTGSNIYEISAIDGSDLRGGPIVNGHFKGNINYLSVHPNKKEFATVGEDCYLRIWDMNFKTLLKVALFETTICAVAYSTLGDTIVVGLGGESSSKCGTFIVLNEEDLSFQYETRDTTKAITVVKYSPDGETLAVASEDFNIYLYAVNDEYELIGRCLRHTAPVTHIDFSIDGEWLRSNSSSKELYFFNTDDATFQSNIQSMRDIEWASSTCIYSWNTKDIHNSNWENENVVTLHSNSNYLACATSKGYVRLHKNPCANDRGHCHRYGAHIGRISCLSFSYEFKTLLTTGSIDKAIIQWKVIDFHSNESIGEIEEVDSDDLKLEAFEDSDVAVENMPESSEYFDSFVHPKPSDNTRGNLPIKCDIWLENIVAPSVTPNPITEVPALSLKLEYVYGINSQGLRNNLRFSNTNEIVFTCSTIGIVMNTQTRSQRYYHAHTDRITAFCCSNDGTLAATGQLGVNPVLTVWETVHCKLLAKMPDIFKSAVAAVAFSNNNRYLACVAVDPTNTITVYDWVNGIILSRSYGGGSRILGLSFSPDDNRLCFCGVKEISFLENVSTRHVTLKSGIISGDIGKLQTFLSTCYFHNLAVVAAYDGHLYVFNDINLQHTVKAHSSSVFSLAVEPMGTILATGGKDGVVRLWNIDFDCIKEVVIDALISTHSSIVKSIAFSLDGSLLAIGTRAADILTVELNNNNYAPKILLSCHGSRELWGLATHPTKEEFITTGDDSTIRVWDSKSYRLLKSIKVDSSSRAVSYSPNGKMIAVGFGSGKKIKGKSTLKEGAFVVLNSSDFKIFHEGKDSNEAIRVIKFSPDNAILICGSDDSKIYVYNAKNQFMKLAVVVSHKAPIRSIDFSSDSNYIFSVDSTNRIKYSEVVTGIEITSAIVFRDKKWSSWTSPVGWQVKGFWMRYCTDSDNLTCSQRSHSKYLLCAGTESGKVVLSQNPSYKLSGTVTGVGHSGPVSACGWIAGDSYLISIGRKDHATFQWKVVYKDTKESGDEAGPSGNDSVTKILYENNFNNFEKISSSPTWLQNISPPSIQKLNFSKDSSLLFDFDLKYCHGLRFSDCRNTIHYNFDGNIVTFMSTMGIVFNLKEFSQLFYKGHKFPIVSIALAPFGYITATSEISVNPEIHLWDSRSASNIIIFTNIHRNGVSALKFSESGEYLVSLGQDQYNSIAVYRTFKRNWKDGYVVFTTPTSLKRMLWLLFSELNEYPIIVGGKNSIYFVKPTGKFGEIKNGEFGKKRKIQTLLCAIKSLNDSLDSQNSDILTGTVSGHIYRWSNCRIVKSYTVHDAPVNLISNLRQGYVTAGKEGLIKLWNSNFQLLHKYDIQDFSPLSLSISCHCLTINSKGTKLAVGIRGGECYEINLSTHSVLLLTESHHNGKLYGFDSNPVNTDEFATAGGDGFIKIWSYKKVKCLRSAFLDLALRSVSWSLNGNILVLGVGGDDSKSTKDGTFIVLDSESLKPLFEDRKAKKAISHISFSRSGEILGISSLDGKIYLHDANTYKLIETITIPFQNSYINCFDFCTDSKYLRISANKENLIYYNITTKELFQSPLNIKDVIWNTYNVPYDYNTQGIWNLTDNSSPLVCATSKCRQFDIIAASYSNGEIRLYRYPCNDEVNLIKSFQLSTAAVSLSFSYDGNYLVVLETLTRNIIVFNIAVT